MSLLGVCAESPAARGACVRDVRITARPVVTPPTVELWLRVDIVVVSPFVFATRVWLRRDVWRWVRVRRFGVLSCIVPVLLPAIPVLPAVPVVGGCVVVVWADAAMGTMASVARVVISLRMSSSVL